MNRSPLSDEHGRAPPDPFSRSPATLPRTGLSPIPSRRPGARDLALIVTVIEAAATAGMLSGGRRPPRRWERPGKPDRTGSLGAPGPRRPAPERDPGHAEAQQSVRVQAGEKPPRESPDLERPRCCWTPAPERRRRETSLPPSEIRRSPEVTREAGRGSPLC